MKTPKQKEVEQSLMEQLAAQEMDEPYYIALVKDYIYYYELINKLKKDIKTKGVRYQTTNGNGKEIEKPNESIALLHKTTQTMLKIIQDLGLQNPIKKGSTSGYV